MQQKLEILNLQSHYSYLDVVMVEGSFPHAATITSLSKPRDIRTVTKPATFMEEIEHFIGTIGVVLSATIPPSNIPPGLSLSIV